MEDTLKKDIEAIVAEIFSQNEEAKKIEKTEDALNKSAEVISELTTSLEDKNTKGEEMSSKLNDLEESIKNLTTELEAAQAEVEQSNEKLADTENKIEEMKKDKAAEVRMNELVSGGVALSDKKTQTVKVREMDDELFASYKDELVSLRKAVEDELAKTDEEKIDVKPEEDSTKSVDDETANEDTTDVGEEVADEETSKDDETAPANIDPDVAVAAAMNLEIQPSDNVVSKYQKLGKAMADKMKNN